MEPQSGQVQVTALQLMPQKFSSMQSEQIMNPQGQVQQNICSWLQAAQRYCWGRLRIRRRRVESSGWLNMMGSLRWNAFLFA
jgi:hypothetical protein